MLLDMRSRHRHKKACREIYIQGIDAFLFYRQKQTGQAVLKHCYICST